MTRVEETRYTCAACGNVWYYGKLEQLRNASAMIDNAGKEVACCMGCAPAALISDKQTFDPRKCSKCGSSSSSAENVVHEVQ